MTKKRATLAQRDTTITPTARATDSLLFGAERARREVVDVPVQEIMPNQRQPRQQMDQEKLAELAANIRTHGVIQPLIVRSISLTSYDGHGCRYELVAGERRWRASMLAERATVPVLIRTDTDNAAMSELAIIENLQREDLHPLDEGRAFQALHDEFDYSYAQIAERVGKSKGYVQNRMRLPQLPDDLQQVIAARPDTISHVMELAKIPDHADRAALVAGVRDAGWSYGTTRDAVERQRNPVSAQDEPGGGGSTAAGVATTRVATPGTTATRTRPSDAHPTVAAIEQTASSPHRIYVNTIAPAAVVFTEQERHMVQLLITKAEQWRGAPLVQADQDLLEQLRQALMAIHYTEEL